MDDGGFLALAEAVVGYVDERFGRAAAWASAIAALMLLPVFLLVALWLAVIGG